MTNTVNTMTRYIDAARLLMEGDTESSDTVFTGHDIENESAVIATIEMLSEMARDVVVLLFHAAGEEGPAAIGVAVTDGALIKLQFGTLWLTPDGRRAVLVPRGCGKRFGHYAIEKGRVVCRAGWPARDLARGTARAARRLRELADAGAQAPGSLRAVF